MVCNKLLYILCASFAQLIGVYAGSTQEVHSRK